MKLKYYIKYQVLGSAYTHTTGCRTKQHVQHMINEIRNKTLISFETNSHTADISNLEITGNNGKALRV